MTWHSPRPAPDFDMPPHRLSGVVYGCLLNHAPALAALGDAVHAAPYKAPPKAPVLYIKPRNTLVAVGTPVVVPSGVPALRVGAALGLVLARIAHRVAEADALDHLAGVLIVNDLCIPHDSFYRPSLRYIARDGFCPLGGRVVPLNQLPAAVDALAVRVLVDGAVAQRTDTAGRIRGAARLLADVSDFMTLQAGDVLMLGVSHGAPLARAGQTVVIEIDGLGRLVTPLVAEADAEAGEAGP